jgi:hypothetical protein
MSTQIELLEDDEVENVSRDVVENAELDEEFYPVEYSITSYGADYPVDGLVKRLNADSILIPPFQRGYVWNIYRASRFIESLLLGLPVPAIFLCKEERTQKLLVIDGQQRLRTLQYFYEGVFESTGSAFKLKQVQSRFEGLTYKTLREDDRLRLDDSILHAIVVKQEKPDEDQSSIYHIFERLNTGGVLLQPQEIRACVYHGDFARLLSSLNLDENWRAVFGKVSTRMRDQELILRFLALLFRARDYNKPMKEFLNRFMAHYRDLTRSEASSFAPTFKETVALVRSALGDKAFKPKRAVNAALCDAIMVGVARRLQQSSVTDPAKVKEAYEVLLKNNEFQAAISSSTTNDSSVSERLRLATEAFSNVP